MAKQKYKVQKNDTLAKLGNPKEILKMNPGVVKLSQGQTIYLPKFSGDQAGGAYGTAAKYTPQLSDRDLKLAQKQKLLAMSGEDGGSIFAAAPVAPVEGDYPMIDALGNMIQNVGSSISTGFRKAVGLEPFVTQYTGLSPDKQGGNFTSASQKKYPIASQTNVLAQPQASGSFLSPDKQGVMGAKGTTLSADKQGALGVGGGLSADKQGALGTIDSRGQVHNRTTGRAQFLSGNGIDPLSGYIPTRADVWNMKANARRRWLRGLSPDEIEASWQNTASVVSQPIEIPYGHPVNTSLQWRVG